MKTEVRRQDFRESDLFTDKQLEINLPKVNSLNGVSSNDLVSNTKFACCSYLAVLICFRFTTSNDCLSLINESIYLRKISLR